MGRFSVVQLLAVANILVQGFTPCTIPTGNIVACGPEDVCTRQLQNARKCCAIVGNCYKDRRYSLKPVAQSVQQFWSGSEMWSFLEILRIIFGPKIEIFKIAQLNEPERRAGKGLNKLPNFGAGPNFLNAL